jgi:hydroxymethylbilane synthase
MKLKMGTRGSPLALAQSGLVARALEKLNPGTSVETVVIKTSGDAFQTQPAGAERGVPQGAKGLFVKEIEEALLEDKIDFAVHSGKDLPADLAPGLEIAAYPQREDARDVFIGRDGLQFAALKPGHKVATSSLRRAIQLKRVRPGVETVPMRGNVDTRIKKLEAGECDGLLLAAAGLKRLGKLAEGQEYVEPDVIVPAPAQGALAVEIRSGRPEISAAVAKLDHAATRRAVECERSFMAAAGGGCATPLGAWARETPSGLTLSVFWSREDGSGAVNLSLSAPAGSEPARFGKFAAAALKK